VQVYMRVPLDICERRDPKGLYRAARAGELKGLTGECESGFATPPSHDHPDTGTIAGRASAAST